MTVNTDNLRTALRAFDFRTLFLEELGWDSFNGQLAVPAGDATFHLKGAAEKRGLTVFVCQPSVDGLIPDRATRAKIERQVAKQHFEHLIIFVDAAKTTQVWQWVKRERGKPAVPREQTFTRDLQEQAILEKLDALQFPLDVEELLTLSDVQQQVAATFDANAEKVTKKFYERFQKEHAQFLGFIAGIERQADRAWYASLMLNRLMFVYFIQKKGFLDGNRDYLTERMRAVAQRHGKDKFHTFYRTFLMRLFHEGLGSPLRTSELEALIGDVPYLNGGIFDEHELERANPDIAIPDEAFERLFAFFDNYRWHLDDRPLKRDDEINPDVLGYIFEKYVNQKQMGAYYTKEDITDYIGKNTIIPFLFDAAQRECEIAFRADGPLWRLLREEPDRYLYPAVRKGTDRPLPPEIEAGITSIPARGGWNKPAAEEYALPTETWREHVARRQRHDELWAKLVDGEVHEINDLITYNLDIRQFAQDAIQSCEGPELLLAFYTAIKNVTVLDPTCGSGAFLFAALNILQPLYDACLDRMESFVEGNERPKYKDLHDVLDEVKRHPNRRYFILKSIILNNLYGVDIMEEATEICKLRLFLKLVSTIAPGTPIEPLPDIDFNIRAGNTLVGFATYDEVRTAVLGGDQKRMDLDNRMPRIEEQARLADAAFQRFHAIQTGDRKDGASLKEAKAELNTRLSDLRAELDRYLAGDYAISTGSIRFKEWRESHQPFHWFIEFYRTMRLGGFDVILGNPPYVEYSSVKKQYKIHRFATERTGNLYAFVLERSLVLGRPTVGRFGMIIPLSAYSTDRMAPLVQTFFDRVSPLYIVNLSGDANPSVLFPGVKFRLAIVLCEFGRPSTKQFTTKYTKWFSDERPGLFDRVVFQQASTKVNGSIPKIPGAIYSGILHKMLAKRAALGRHMAGPKETLYHNAPVSWIRSHPFVPYFSSERDGEKQSTQLKSLQVRDDVVATALSGILCSTTFFAWWITSSDCYHLNLREIEHFPINLADAALVEELAQAAAVVVDDMKRHVRRRVYVYQTSGRVEYDEFYPKLSKHLIDEVDRILARYYAFTDEELDFILNYDIKYRMGRDADNDAA